MKSPLDDLQRRIDAARGRDASEPPPAEGVGAAMQMGLELAAGTLVGGGLGWAVDNWLNLTPLFTILGFLFGFAGGFLNMKKVAERLDTADSSATTPRARNSTEKDHSSSV